MKDNKDILNEAFFKKTHYKDKLVKSLPAYSPTSASKGFVDTAYGVSDVSEVKERLYSTLGAKFGSNNIKSMASKAVKKFPIIVSDNISPETVIMLKKLLEEQYAEYINLLISNEVVDLSVYKGGQEGSNIAIQALDKISGSDFSRSRVANKASSGKLNTEDIYSNIPLYQVLRENKIEIDMDDSVLNSLFENACIVPTKDADTLVRFIQENASEILREDDDFDEPTQQVVGIPTFNKDTNQRLSDYISNEIKNEVGLNYKRGYHGEVNGKSVYSKLSTADVVIDSNQMDKVINRTVGELLADPKNVEILRKFEAATMLLQSNLIAGVEYINYLDFRLGIPVSDKARKELVSRFKMSSVRTSGGVNASGNDETNLISKDEISNIANNRKITTTIVNDICSVKVKDLVKSLGKGAVAGGAVATGAVIAGIALSPLLLGAVAACAVGTGSYLLYSLTRKKRAERIPSNTSKIEGWERVEALIEKMEAQRAEIRRGGYKPEVYDSNVLKTRNPEIGSNIESFERVSKKDFETAEKTVSSMVARALRENNNPKEQNFTITESQIEEAAEMIFNLSEELNNDELYRKETLVEAKLASLTRLDKGPEPVKIKYIESKPGKDVLITPSYASRTSLAYGSAEIDRRDNKDRRYDQPLIMTVKFKERFGDDKFSDNELTAVIGILGKIIRVPSEEMEYILKENTKGNAVENLFKNPSEFKNVISDIMSTSKLSKELKALPQSADIWHNLEKVATLAAANNISGRRHNNIANAHIIFSQKELDTVRNDLGIDYMKDIKHCVALMKRYSAFTLMVANDAGQRAYIFDDQDDISWNVVPYSALLGKDTGDQLSAALAKLTRY